MEVASEGRHGGSGFLTIIVLAVLAIGGLFLFNLAQHLNDTRTGDVESRMDTWRRMENRLKNRQKNNGNDNGTDYYAASCMLSTVRSMGSPRQGEPNPHFKLAVCRSGVCDYAIIGVAYEEAVVVTARGGVPLSVYKSEVRKDVCISAKVDDVIAIMEGRIPVP